MIQLLQHQKDIIKDDRKHAGLWLGTGSTKTAISLLLARGKTLVICLKQQAEEEKFQKEAEKFEIKDIELTVVSKERLKKDLQNLLKVKWDTVIIDELQKITSGLSTQTQVRKGVRIPKMSQLYKDTLTFLSHTRPERFYCLSATPNTKAMRVLATRWVFAAAKGTPIHNWEYFDFLEKYYREVQFGMFRKDYKERKDEMLQAELTKEMQSYGYVGKLDDWFDVPPQVQKTEYVSMSAEQKKAIKEMEAQQLEDMQRVARERAIQNGVLYDYVVTTEEGVDRIERVAKTFSNEKTDRIVELAEEFPRLLVFARYTAQIEMIKERLVENGYDVVTLTGKTKDRKNAILEADKRDCIVIAQSQISEGYELKTFRCTVFASKSAMAEDYIQAMGRTLRADALHKNLFVHLVVKGGADERCHKTILSGKDFQEKL
jgi:hypothetical protein